MAKQRNSQFDQLAQTDAILQIRNAKLSFRELKSLVWEHLIPQRVDFPNDAMRDAWNSELNRRCERFVHALANDRKLVRVSSVTKVHFASIKVPNKRGSRKIAAKMTELSVSQVDRAKRTLEKIVAGQFEGLDAECFDVETKSQSPNLEPKPKSKTRNRRK